MDGPGTQGTPPSVRPGEELIGTEVSGKYRILKLLGEGAMGAVYLGEHTRIGRKDAIKILRKGLTTDAESIARFNRGARNLSAIRHPNVCTLYDYGETADGSPFLALELIDGESLKELIEHEQALDPRRAINIALQTAQALDAAHHAGIVHRDLKPANIMLETGRDGSDVVKVVDFDIAKGPEPEGGEEVTRLGYVVGTPEYMSPEQLTGEKLDGRSDLYSLGVTFYRMLTGVLPFRGTDVQKIMIERLTERPVPLSEARPDLAFPQEVQHVLDRALARDRGERYPRAADFAKDLADLQQTIAAAPVGPPPPREVPQTRVAPSSGSISSPKAVASTPAPRGVPAWLIASAVLAVAGAGVTAWIVSNGGSSGGESTDPGQQSGPAGGDSGQVIVSGGDSTDIGGGGTDSSNTGGGGQTNRGGGGGQTDPDDPPRPTSTRLTVLEALDVLFDLDQSLDPDGDGAYITNRAVLQAVADTTERIWNLTGISRRDSAMAAYVRGSAAIALGNRQDCARWLDRAIELDQGGATTLRQRCQRMDE
jgi:serine/threonine-protein kinase